jgi:hypothetical protein
MFLNIAQCPVVEYCLPIPRPMGDRIVYIEGGPEDLALRMTALSRLSSPIRPSAFPAWMVKIKDLPRLVGTSNVQPLIITGLRSSHQSIVSALADLTPTAPASIVLQGDESVVLPKGVKRMTPPCETMMTLEEMMVLPFENIGAFTLRRFARGEPIFGPMESREDRRNRLIKERNAPT